MSDVTILIAARNAAETIERAVASALAEPADCVLLIDDFSEDATVARAQALDDGRLRVVRPPVHTTLGATRQFGLEQVQTTYGIWLDADDAFLPGRTERLLEAMQVQGADLASDGVELFDGPSDAFLRQALIPEFLYHDRWLVRQFERNYLPGAGQVAFRVERLRSLGYATDLTAAEDTDILLRSALARVPVALVPVVGYRMCAYPGSVSRNLERQQAMNARALARVAYGEVLKLYVEAGYAERFGWWALHAMATFRKDWAQAGDCLGRLTQMDGKLRSTVLEPNGPLPRPEGWRVAFAQGVLAWELGMDTEAAQAFRTANTFAVTAEGTNNLGITLRTQGAERAAQDCFASALEAFPDYLDARLNRSDTHALQLTRQPLRQQPGRFEYPQAVEADVANPS
ncbi:MAG: glycosyltransferase [Opitutales bacterium]